MTPPVAVKIDGQEVDLTWVREVLEVLVVLEVLEVLEVPEVSTLG